MQHLPFGSFNPRFYGVSLTVGDRERFEALREYHNAETLTPGAAGEGRQSIEEISTISAIDHELRHFHDFLVSPLGTVMMGLRMQASINGVQAAMAIKRCGGQYAPAPVGRWMQWNIAARQEWIRSTGRFFGIERLEDFVVLPSGVDISHLTVNPGAHSIQDSLAPEQELAGHAKAAAQAYSSMKSWRQQRVSDVGFDVAADDIFEAAAHIVQMQAVWNGQGAAAAETFLRFVLTSATRHLRPLQVLWTALERAPQTVSAQRISELITWMMLGSGEDLAARGNPAFRYAVVLTLAAASPANEVFVDQMPTMRLFHRLDGIAGTTEWKRNLLAAGAAADRRVKLYLQLSNTCAGGYYDALFAVAHQWHKDQSAARQTFMADPESLAHPTRYLSERAYPLPFVETRFGSMAHRRSINVDPATSRAVAIDAGGRNIISYISCLDSSQPIECLDSVFDARLTSHLIDLLFLDEPALDLYENYWRSRLGSILGKEVVSVY
jgi:hypothetical protein